MPLPVTITGISTAVAPVGPFKRAAGDYAFAAIDTGAVGTVDAGLQGPGTSFIAQAQSFTNGGSSLVIPSVGIKISKTGTPTDNVYAEITNADPSGTVVATSNVVACSTITGTGFATATVITFTFPSPPTIAASATFSVILRRTATDASNYPKVATSSSSTYAGGSKYSLGGSTWTAQTASDIQITVNTAVTLTDAYYFFGRDGTTATTLQAFKSTAPDTSWASIATKTGFTTAILNIAAYQAGTVIHMAVQDGTMSSSVATKYVSFNTANDTFLASIETILAASTITGQSASGWGVSLAVRSTDEVVCLYNSTATNTSGTPRARLGYKRRTGLNTWSAAVQVDGNVATDATTPVAVLGATNRVHFTFTNGTGTGYRTLSAANALNTLASTASMTAPGDGVSYDRAGVIKVVVTSNANASQGTLRFDSSDNPTPTFANQSIAAATIPHRIGTFPNTDDVTIVYRSSADSDLYSIKSSDDGATFSAPVSFFAGTVANADANVSRSSTGSVYQRGSNTVVGYLVNDNGTLKYNEYTLSPGVTHYTMPAATGTFALTGRLPGLELARAAAKGSIVLTGLPTALRSIRKLTAAQGVVALTGIDATLTKSTAVIHYTMPATVGVFALSGAATALKAARKLPVTVGSFALSGQDAALTRLANKTLAVTTGSYVLTGTGVGLRAVRSLAATTGNYLLTGVPAALVARRKVAAAMGHYALSGTVTGFLLTRRLVAEASSYVLAGTDATLKRITGRFVSAQTGSYALAGQAVSFQRTYRVAADAGNYVLTGTDASLSVGGEVKPPIFVGGGGITRPPQPYLVEGTGFGILPPIDGVVFGLVIGVGNGRGQLPGLTGQATGSIGAVGFSAAQLAISAAGSGRAGAGGKGFGMMKLEGAADGDAGDDDAEAVAFLLAA